MTAAAFLVLIGLGAQEGGEAERLAFFEAKIRPVLAERCYACHSVRAGTVKAGLLLDSREGILRGGESGPAVVPGEPDRSSLVRAVRQLDVDLQMPPKGRLTPEQIADVVSWVRMGAPHPASEAPPPPKAAYDFVAARARWPYVPPVAPPVPAVKDVEWSRDPIDRFLLARWEEKGLRPVADADRRVLLRRVTFDLLGLPPTPEEVEAFVADPAPDAFAKVVERLLSSPRYGERWGRHWLDVVRYADTAGDSSDYPVPQARLYRDYVIRAFNEDKPYDRFLAEQLAGDLLPDGGRDGILATGFLAIARRFGEDPAVDHHLTIDDTLDTFGRAFLGLTISCARCHDHKFDPIPAEDYYGLYGVFQSTRYPYAGSDKMKFQKDFIPLVPREEAERILKPFEQAMAVLEVEAKPLEAEIAARERELSGDEASSDRPDPRTLQDLRKALGELRKKRETLARKRPAIDDAYAVAEGPPVHARVHVKGNPRQLGPEVPRHFLQVLGAPSTAPLSGSGRRELAAWLTEPSHPLTARVMVNRIWQHHFGRGIVSTPSYFGRQGAPPTHPELLDHLATEFVKSGWSIKAMHRRILFSRTYRLASVGRPENDRLDPAHELLWKFPRRRLEAEAIRDAMLAVAGTLDPSPPGAHPFPAPDTWSFSKAAPFYAVYPSDRRSVYLMQQRLKRHPFLALFDGPDTNSGTATRNVTTTPIQALFLMNSPFVREQATRLAERLAKLAPEERIDRAHRLALGRPATSSEVDRAKEFIRGLGSDAWVAFARVLLSSNEFVYVD